MLRDAQRARTAKLQRAAHLHAWHEWCSWRRGRRIIIIIIRQVLRHRWQPLWQRRSLVDGLASSRTGCAAARYQAAACIHGVASIPPAGGSQPLPCSRVPGPVIESINVMRVVCQVVAGGSNQELGAERHVEGNNRISQVVVCTGASFPEHDTFQAKARNLQIKHCSSTSVLHCQST